MSGHSKWANIKHRKEKADRLKGKLFSRAAKEIISAVKQGGADPKSNNKLKIAIQKAKEANLPNEIIERNIKKAGSQDQADYVEMTYELYGHGGVGIIVEIMTDNKNRIASEIRIGTNKYGGTVAMPGAVAFNFDRKGVIRIDKKDAIEDELFNVASENGAEDFEAIDEEGYIITSAPENLLKLKEAIAGKGIKIKEATLEMLPKLFIECSDENKKANLALIDYLENLEDVDSLFHNMQL